MKTQFIALLLFAITRLSVAQTTQTIRGVVLDQDSRAPIPGASVVLLDAVPMVGVITGPDGQYALAGVPIGRHTLKVTSVGYEDIVSTNVLVLAGKQLELNVDMKESLISLKEVVVTADGDKTELNNDLALVSGRTFNVEETSRYAGSRNDVSRMAQNFAGVSNVNDARNDIVIRGNSPAGLLWRLDGIDIPSPNHFAAFGSTGGPVGMLNNNTLAKSDFITAAFPATYGNAIGGVFDLRMRNGNNLKREYLGQLGFNGLEFGAEGPVAAGKRATFMINYRYSTLGIFKAVGLNFGTGSAVPGYQDLSFKINLPTQRSGRFSIFGVGGKSDISFLGSQTDFSQTNSNLYGDENQNLYDQSKTGVLGVSHTYVFSPRTTYQMTVATSGMQTVISQDSVAWSSDPTPKLKNITHSFGQSFKQTQQSGHLTVNHKFSAADMIIAGMIVNYYQVSFGDSILRQTPVHNTYWRPMVRGSGNSLLTQGYVNWQHRFSETLTLNAGGHVQYFSLGHPLAWEPRAGLRYQFTPRQSLSLGVGIHNQIQALPVYYLKTYEGGANSNQNLGFTRSRQLALAYDYNFQRDFRIKLETYYQAIDRAPIEQMPSSFSMLNAGADFVLPAKFNLVNQGIGRNYGVELTAEKFYSHQFYFLLTTSLFKSAYQGSDAQWRSTAFDGRYIVNLLGGKEWNLRRKNRTLGVSLKMTQAGGRRYTPIDRTASLAAGQVTYLDNQAYSLQYPAYFRTDVRVTYRVNKGKMTMEWALDVQNVTNHQNIFMQNLDVRTGAISNQYQLGIFPVPQFRILF